MEVNAQIEQNEKKPEKLKPKILGFWKRLFAFILDGFILGIVGIIIGVVLYDFFAELGGWGRLFGFVVALLYFGILNSAFANGQTIGKRLLKIRVVDKETKTIPFSKSVLRFTILWVPYFLNGALLPPSVLTNSLITLILGIIVFFGSGSIIYLFIFNRETRQSLHDLIIGSYVVNITSDEKLLAKPIWKGHLSVLATLFVTVIILITSVIPHFASKEPFSDLIVVQENIQQTGLVHVATVTVGKSFGTNLGAEGKEKWESTYLSTNAVLKHRPTDYDMVINQIASIILETYPQVFEKNILVINATYGYDIGISRAWKSQRRQNTPQKWKEQLSEAFKK